jgi:16S rRNA (guanine1207-N2)-methyltransferase
VLETAPNLFSPRRVDAGTLSMLSHVEFSEQDKVLDLGCGYGVVGIYAAKRIDPSRVCMLDNDPKAVALARTNAERNAVAGVHVLLSNGFNDFREAGFTLILCNPPYHSDFSIAKHFIHKGFNRLKVGGKFWMVTQREPWYRNKLRAIFGDVKLHRDAPYTVFEATKHSPRYANAKPR